MIRRCPAFCRDPGTAACAGEAALKATVVAFGILEYSLDIFFIILFIHRVVEVGRDLWKSSGPCCFPVLLAAQYPPTEKSSYSRFGEKAHESGVTVKLPYHPHRLLDGLGLFSV